MANQENYDSIKFAIFAIRFLIIKPNKSKP